MKKLQILAPSLVCGAIAVIVACGTNLPDQIVRPVGFGTKGIDNAGNSAEAQNLMKNIKGEEYTYERTKGYFNAWCVSCHSPTGSVPASSFTNLETIKLFRERIIERISSESSPMPPELPMGAKRFDATVDGAIMKAWLTSGPDVSGPSAAKDWSAFKDVKYGDIKADLVAKCANCHSDNGTPPSLTNFAKSKAARDSVIKKLPLGTMPQGDVAWIKSEAGQKLEGWFNVGADITGNAPAPTEDGPATMASPTPSPAPAASPSPGPAVTFAMAQPELMQHCGGANCHDNAGRMFRFTNDAQAKAQRNQALARINGNTMPSAAARKTAFDQDAAGKALIIQYLNTP